MPAAGLPDMHHPGQHRADPGRQAPHGLTLLETVPELLTEAIGQAYARGHDDVVLGRRSGPAPKPKRPRAGTH